MTKHSDSSSEEVSREPRERSFPVSRSAKEEPDNSLVNLLRQGMLFAQGQGDRDPHAQAIINPYEILPFRTSVVPVSDPISPRAQQPLDELLEEVMQLISTTDDLGDGTSGRRCHTDRSASHRDGSASHDRGPLLPKQ